MNRSRMRTAAGPEKRRGGMLKAASSRATTRKPGSKSTSAPSSRSRSSGLAATSRTSGGRASSNSEGNSRGQTGKSAKPTTDHEVIRRWVEERGGSPAIVKRSTKGKGGGILRIDFPGFSGAQSLTPISWDEWFNIFEERRLALLVQKKTASGKQSRFSKLVSR